jgi:fructose-1,6-bisphosphatase/inositol monophosphatase family enzyme
MTGFTRDDLAALRALLRRAGQREVMPRFRRLGAESIRTKSGPLDLVTDADLAAEAMIARALRRRFPGCLVVGEEAASADPTLLRQLDGATLAFVVDPIDGTANYAAGLPVFATMAAAICDGQVVASCIHDPVLDESCLALAGQGAWAESPLNGPRDLQVSAPMPFAEMTGFVSWRFLPEPRRSRVMRNLLGLRAAWDFRCAAQHYRLIAGGQCDFSFYNRLLPWDHAPGWLLHKEAGGFAARFDGSDYSPLSTAGGLICAPDEASWRTLRDGLL